jgi:ADP-heptose:LPS heptosyltransferase
MRRKSKKIIIHTGSVWKMRLWENKKWISLLKKINKLGKFNFIFIGSTDIEKKSFEYIQKNLDFKIFSLINKLDLKETLLLMRMSDYFIGIDSGPRNMAHLADLRSISLLSTGLNNFMPSNKKDIVINKSDAIFTSIFYYPKKNYMQEITTEEVLEAFKKLSKTI